MGDVRHRQLRHPRARRQGSALTTAPHARVLYVIDSLAPGGAETSLAAMATGLIAGGIDLDIAYFIERPGVHDRLRDAGATLTHLGEQRSRLGRIVAVRRLIKTLRPDLVHTTLFEADVAGRVAAASTRTPVVSSLVSTAYGPEHRQAVPHAWKLRIAHTLDAATAQVARRFHANSIDTADAMARRLHVSRSKIDVVHRGRSSVDLGRRDPQRTADVRRRLGIDGRTPMVLAVARHDHAKGLDVLVRAVPELRRAVPDVRVFVAGREGTHTPEIHRLIAALDPVDVDAIELLGHRADLADLLAAADVLAFPSRKEGLPGTLIEAAALECPIVATDLGPVREVVGDPVVGDPAAGDPPAAILVPVDDPTALAVALARLLADPTLSDGLVAAGRRRFDQAFTIEHAVAGMLAFYDRVLNQERAGR